MPDVDAPPVRRAAGGRPRQYPSHASFMDLVGRVAVLEVSPARPAPAGTDGAALPVAASDDKAFIGECVVAMIAAGVYKGADGDIPGMSAVANAMLICRDLVVANMGAMRDRRMAELRANGSLSCFGIRPE